MNINPKINFAVSGAGPDIIFLYGWQQSLRAWDGVADKLGSNFKIWRLDLPGFGASPRPSNAWGVAEYAVAVGEFIRENKIQNPILVGHSFGGRIGVTLAASKSNPVRKLILVGSAGIKPNRSAKQILASIFSVFIPRFLREKMIEKILPESDLARAGSMRDIFRKVVAEDLRGKLSKIEIPTLLIWGENDRETPVADGKIMRELIPNSKLTILPSAGHFAYSDRPADFVRLITDFAKSA